ncbi:hypothetical protein JY97_08000 [Alkalispirochaeta odontotermitis]|nr:hypothetical protein JY97_08000 [Alkalispirochaeta odontotermitis]CAB1074928.1 hypothetical protein D1AOALGA4SA_2748 [Olavius algarvensis Delta 1 endosymbiont]
MQWFGATYSRRFNHHHDRRGHLFQGRYKNMLVQNDAYLLQLSYYIHRNPLKFDLELGRKSVRIPKWARTDRDLRVYIPWQLGVATNQQIGD